MERRRRRVTRRGLEVGRLVFVLGVIAVVVLGILGARYFLRPDPAEGGREWAERAFEALEEGRSALRQGLEAEAEGREEEAGRLRDQGRRRLEEARLLYTRLVGEWPERIELRRNLASSQAGLGRHDEARRTLEEILRKAPKHGPAHAMLARLAIRREDHVLAVEHARAAVVGRPESVGAHYLLAIALLGAGQYSEGVSALTRAVENGEGGAEAELRLAALLAGRGSRGPAVQRARQSLTRALKEARSQVASLPGDKAAVERHVHLAIAAGKPEEAVAALIRLSTRRNLTDREKILLGSAHARSGSVDRARKVLSEVGEGAATAWERGAGWLDAGEPDKAVREAVRGLVDTPADASLLRLRLRALWLKKCGSPRSGEDPSRLADHIEKAAGALLALRPTDELGLLLRGITRLERGWIEEALADSDRLTAAAPRSAASHWLEGLAHLHAGLAQSALPLLVRGREAAPDRTVAARWILRAALRAGDAEVATREASLLTGPRCGALRAAALALSGDLDGATAAIDEPAFATCPLEDRARLALTLARRGRPGYAARMARELLPLVSSSAAMLRRGELLRAIGDEEGAREATLQASRGEGPAALRALLALGETAILAVPVDDGGLAEICERLRTTSGGRLFARLLEGRACLARGDADGALEAADEAAGNALSAPGARILTLRALQEKGVESARIEDAAEKVLEVAPHDRVARRIRAQALLERVRESMGRGGFADAESGISELLAMNPERMEVLFFRGYLRTLTGEFSGAEEDARELLDAVPGSAGGHLLMGLVRYREGALEEAVSAFRLAVEASPESPGALAVLGMALIEAGRAEAALPLADRCAELSPDSPRAMAVRIGALVALRRFAEAVSLLEARAEVDEDVAGVRLLLGRVLLLAGRGEEAVEAFEAAVALRPDVAPAYAHLVWANLATGRTSNALAAAEAALGQEGLEVPGLILRARVRRAQGLVAGEVADLYSAVGREPDNPLPREILGRRLLELGRDEEGLGHLGRVRELAPHDVAVRMLLVREAEEAHRTRDAVLLYEEILGIAPGHAVAANNLAVHLIGNPATLERAVRLARAAVARSPADGDFRDTLALALSASGEHEAAVREAGEAVRLLPKKASVRLTAARVHAAAGRMIEAARAAAGARRHATDEERESIQRRIRELDLPPVR